MHCSECLSVVIVPRILKRFLKCDVFSKLALFLPCTSYLLVFKWMSYLTNVTWSCINNDSGAVKKKKGTSFFSYTLEIPQMLT